MKSLSFDPWGVIDRTNSASLSIHADAEIQLAIERIAEVVSAALS